MKITISDTSFHKKIISRYGKGFRIRFPSMFFLKCARNYLSRIINMHVRLNFQIQNKYMDLSSVLLQEFQKMTSGFNEINKFLVNVTTTIFRTPIFSIVNYKSKKLVLFQKQNAVYEKRIFNFPLIINQTSPTGGTVISARIVSDLVLNYSTTANSSILKRTISSQIFNHIKTTTKNFFGSDSAINNISSNYLQTTSNNTISLRIVSDRPFYHSMTATTNNYSTQTKPVNYWHSNYLKTFNNVIFPGILNKRTLEYQIWNNIFSYPNVLNHFNSLNYLRTKKAQTVYGGNNFSSGRTGDDQISNYSQIWSNIFSYPNVLNHFNSLNYLRTKKAQTVYGGNNFSSGRTGDDQISNYSQIWSNIFSYPNVLNHFISSNYLRTRKAQTVYGGNNFILRFIGKHNNISKKILYHHIKDTHKIIVSSPGRSIHFGPIIQSKPEVQNGINGLNNQKASADIVFRKTHIENKITGENKQPNEKTISEKIRADKQIINVPAHMLQGEISSIANKVYKLLERRLSIEKEKRGVHIIG